MTEIAGSLKDSSGNLGLLSALLRTITTGVIQSPADKEALTIIAEDIAEREGDRIGAWAAAME